jgi:hypothetical protein
MPNTTIEDVAADDTWVLAAHVEHLTKNFAYYAERADEHYDRAQAWALGNVLTHLHGLTDGRLGLSSDEVQSAINGSQTPKRSGRWTS